MSRSQDGEGGTGPTDDDDVDDLIEDALARYRDSMLKANEASNELKALLAEPASARGKLTIASDRLSAAEQSFLRRGSELEALLLELLVIRYQADEEGRPILAAARLMLQPVSPRDMKAEAAISKPLSQLMEYLGDNDRYHAAHLIAHRFGGEPGRSNLVPLEARANTSYMKMSENRIAQRFREDPTVDLYAIVRPLYYDPPAELSRPFEERSPNPSSRYSDKVPFSLMDLRRVPDEISYRVVDVKSSAALIDESFFPGGPLMDYIATTRRGLLSSNPELAAQVMDSAARKTLIDKLKRQSRPHADE